MTWLTPLSASGSLFFIFAIIQQILWRDWPREKELQYYTIVSTISLSAYYLMIGKSPDYAWTNLLSAFLGALFGSLMIIDETKEEKGK